MEHPLAWNILYLFLRLLPPPSHLPGWPPITIWGSGSAQGFFFLPSGRVSLPLSARFSLSVGKKINNWLIRDTCPTCKVPRDKCVMIWYYTRKMIDVQNYNIYQSNNFVLRSLNIIITTISHVMWLYAQRGRQDNSTIWSVILTSQRGLTVVTKEGDARQQAS